ACDLRRRADMHACTVSADRRDLGRDRAFGHDDMCGDAACARRQCERRTVIAGGMRRHAARGDVIGQGPHRIAGAAELECADALEVFTLERDRATGAWSEMNNANRFANSAGPKMPARLCKLVSAPCRRPCSCGSTWCVASDCA